MRVCSCHGEPRDRNGICAEKRRVNQRRYWTVKGWARRREREIARQRQSLDQEAEDLGSV